MVSGSEWWSEYCNATDWTHDGRLWWAFWQGCKKIARRQDWHDVVVRIWIILVLNKSQTFTINEINAFNIQYRQTEQMKLIHNNFTISLQLIFDILTRMMWHVSARRHLFAFNPTISGLKTSSSSTSAKSQCCKLVSSVFFILASILRQILATKKRRDQKFILLIKYVMFKIVVTSFSSSFAGWVHYLTPWLQQMSVQGI